tara:strand:- start:47 stop:745 length:699 start_codon:yes stop_codon:yes gene_type:complete
MARISSYQRDTDIQDQDAWIGTESSNRLTRNFTAAAVAKYLNIKGKISISAQMVFQFKPDTPNVGDFAGVVTGTPFANITTLSLSTTDKSTQNVVEFMEYLVGNQVLINAQNNISYFGHYKIVSYANGGSFADSYTLTLQYLGGNGNLTEELYYDFAAFSLPSTEGSETYVFTQAVPANPWVITHNLHKYPSVTVTDNSATPRVVYTIVDYTNINQVTVTFTGAQAGKAYLN